MALLLASGRPAKGGDPAPGPKAEPGTLRFGLDTRSAPLCFVPGLDYSKEDRHKRPVLTALQLRRLCGLEVDVMNALSRRLGVRPVVVPTAWFDLESELLAGRFDVILASWTPNDRTSGAIEASDPYYEWGLLVAARTKDDRIRSVADLAGLKVGHFADPVVTRALKEMGANLGARLSADEDGTDLFEHLRTGAIDALIYDSPEVRWRVAQDHDFRVVGEPLNRLGYHVGVRRADGDLLRRINEAIRGLLPSEEMRALRARWEGN